MTLPKPPKRTYPKTFIPLESDPSVLNNLMHKLGVSNSLHLTDIWSIDDPEQLIFVPRPALALILVLPTTEGYENHRLSTAAPAVVLDVSRREADGVVWISQTIHNACGLYALLHATCNSEAKTFIGYPDSERSDLLVASTDLEIKYREAALCGATAPPPLEEEVDLHYVAFVKATDGTVYEMDGDAKGPVVTNVKLEAHQDMLEAEALESVRQCVKREDADGKFSLLALVRDS